nr:iron ABC transporter permease [Bianquea renquensis]
MGIGRIYMSPVEIVSDLYRILTAGPDSVEPQVYSVLINVRLPRIILAVLCGAGLAVSGAAFQSIFSNALATPDTLGVAAGASFGAALALMLKAGLIVVQLTALTVGFVAVVLTYLISRQRQGVSTVMVVLSGMVIASLFEAGISIIKFVADTESQLPAITYWLMGSLSNTNYRSLALGAPFIMIGIGVIFALRWKLNVLMLSEEEAKTMGVNVKLMRVIVALAATMITASCVSMCGQVGWVGLLIPHICRMLFGSNNRQVVPASISLGASFLLIMDTVARSATAAEIPISILTAMIGAPFFILLLKKTGGANL